MSKEEKREEIEKYTLTDLQNEIIANVKSEIEKENLESKGLFSRKMNIEKTIIQRVWYSIITKIIGDFSVNFQLKRKGVVIFEFEIPKK